MKPIFIESEVRTGRFGRKGIAVNLVSEAELELVADIENYFPGTKVDELTLYSSFVFDLLFSTSQPRPRAPRPAWPIVRSRRLTTTLARRFSRVTYVSAYLVVLLLFLGGLPYIGPTILAALLIDYAIRKFGYSTRQPVHVSLQTKANLRCIAAVMIIAGVALLIFISIPIGVVVALTGALLEDALAGHREITSMNEGPVLLPSMVGRRFLQESDNVAEPEDAPAVCYHNTEACEGGFSSGSCCAICLGSEASPQILVVELTLCRHRFHYSCLLAHISWALRKRTAAQCPLCRVKLLMPLPEG
ncbi:ATPdependent RNA helicase [Perkinsus olseni]|uniref:ATPdependent RNA helicase n=1 Tax=Perkinsus olseni TaxID=32597 RepID=A0A7J6QAE8_PEROL|nr:ATPdependent RNA helicase [Perkinsus olseni]